MLRVSRFLAFTVCSQKEYLFWPSIQELLVGDIWSKDPCWEQRQRLYVQIHHRGMNEEQSSDICRFFRHICKEAVLHIHLLPRHQALKTDWFFVLQFFCSFWLFFDTTSLLKGSIIYFTYFISHSISSLSLFKSWFSEAHKQGPMFRQTASTALLP